jgi:transposase-like protein
MLVLAVNPETGDTSHAEVAPFRITLTPRWFLSELAELYGRAFSISGDRLNIYRPVFTPLGNTHVVRRHSVKNPIEGSIKDLKRHNDMSCASLIYQNVDMDYE